MLPDRIGGQEGEGLVIDVNVQLLCAGLYGYSGRALGSGETVRARATLGEGNWKDKEGSAPWQHRLSTQAAK